jgi:hypothetical protein
MRWGDMREWRSWWWCRQHTLAGIQSQPASSTSNSLVNRFHETNQIGWAEFRPDGPHPEERASKSAVADFDTIDCQSQAGLTLVRAPLAEADEWCRYDLNLGNAPLG